jgi:hypothetical protein
MSSNERELRFRVTSDTAPARADVAAMGASLRSNFGEVSRLGQTAMRGLNTEFAALARHVPVIGPALSHVTRELLSMGGAVHQVNELEGAFRRFRSVLGQVATGGNASAAGEFRNLGIEIETALRNPQAAFGTFITGLRGMQTQAGQTALAVNVLGSNVGSQLLPALQQTNTAAAGTTSRLAAMTSTIGPLLGVIAIAAAGEAALAAAVFKASESWAEYGDSIFKAMQKTGQSAEQLSVIKFATEELKRSNAGTSVSFDQVIRGIARYEANVSRGVTNPTRQAAKSLDALNLSAQQLKNMVPDEAFRTLLTRLDDVKNRFDRDRIASDLFGKDFNNLIPILHTLGHEFDETKARAESMGLIFSGKSAAQARQFQQTLRDLHLAAGGLAIMFGSQVGPEVTKAMRDIMTMVQALRPLIVFAAEAIAAQIHSSNNALLLLVFSFRTIPPTVQVMVDALGVAARAFGDLGSTVSAAGAGLMFFAQGQYQTAVTMFGVATEKAMNVGREAVKQFAGDYIAYMKKVQEIARETFTPAPLPEISTGDTDVDFPTKEKKDHTAEKLARDRLKVLENELRDRERLRDKELDDEKRSYDAQLAGLDEYEAARIVTLTSALFDELAVLNREAAAVRASVLPEEEKGRRLEEIFEKRKQITDDEEKAVNAVRLEGIKIREEAEKTHRAKLIEIDEQSARTRIAIAKRDADYGQRLLPGGG